MDAARFLKRCAPEESAEATSGWFTPPSVVAGSAGVPTQRVREVPYESIARAADDEYESFFNIGSPHVTHTRDDALVTWLRDVPETELAALLEATPTGCAGDAYDPPFLFTPWQRLGMAVYVSSPFDTTSVVHVGTESLRAIGGVDVRRKTPVHAQCSLLRGSMPTYGIIQLPTACGKTAWSLAVAYLSVTKHMERLHEEYRQKRLGEVVIGPPNLHVARIVLVVAQPTTFDHFVRTLHRLVAARDPSDTTHVEVWTSMSARYSVGEAAQRPAGTVVFWVMSSDKLVKALQTDPDVAVAVCITDEFPPRMRAQALSPVLKTMVLQATPHALVQATTGNSWLRTAMGGTLTEPNRVRALLASHAYAWAQQACEQLCKLDMMTLSPTIRRGVRRDLQHLVPDCLRIYFAPSRPSTLTALMDDTDSDFVPASFVNVLLSHLAAHRPDTTQVSALRAYLTSGVTIEGLQTHLRDLRFERVDAGRAASARLVERLEEVKTSCPICMDTPSEGSVNVFGCCGYCVCHSCFACTTQRCPFCRTPVSDVVPRVEEVVEEVLPSPPATAFAFRATVSEADNLTLALFSLVRTSHRRFLLFVARSYHAHQSTTVHLTRLRRILAHTGVAMERVDDALGGKGTKFCAIKKRFDDVSDPAPMAMVCVGHATQFLIGTDLTHADAFVTVGAIPDKTLTQALGRVFRPRVGRDNSKPITMVRVFTPTR